MSRPLDPSWTKTSSGPRSLHSSVRVVPEEGEEAGL